MNIDLPDSIMDIFVEEIRKEINSSVLFEMYKKQGWTPVEGCRNLNFNHPVLKEVEAWLTSMCHGKWHIKSHTDYIFQNPEDAMMFKLKWS